MHIIFVTKYDLSRIWNNKWVLVKSLFGRIGKLRVVAWMNKDTIRVQFMQKCKSSLRAWKSIRLPKKKTNWKPCDPFYTFPLLTMSRSGVWESYGVCVCEEKIETEKVSSASEASIWSSHNKLDWKWGSSIPSWIHLLCALFCLFQFSAQLNLSAHIFSPQ